MYCDIPAADVCMEEGMGESSAHVTGQVPLTPAALGSHLGMVCPRCQGEAAQRKVWKQVYSAGLNLSGFIFCHWAAQHQIPTVMSKNSLQ